jgi:hypothetical protein
MSNLKRKIQNRLMGTLVFGGMALFGGGVPISAYLHHIQPKEPQIVSEYRGLNQEHKYLTSIKQFSLEEALNESYIQEQSSQVDSLSEEIRTIEQSQTYNEITNYEEENSRHNKYWIIPFASIILGASSMFYGVRLESKINSRPSTK